MSAAIDVNTLLYASDRHSTLHARAVEFLRERAAAPDALYLPWPVVMGYLRISTHPRIFVEPLGPADAGRNIDALLNLPHVRVIGEEDGFWKIYLDVVRAAPSRGNHVPDSHVATILRQHGVRTIYTSDRDFRRFDFLRVVDPFA